MKSASLQYANALADIALEQGAADPIRQQLSDFGAAYAESAELRNILSHPSVELSAKHAVIEKLVSRLGASKVLRNFLFVVVDHQRAHLLPEMVAMFGDVVRQRLGLAEAQITSAMEMNAAQKAQLQQTLEKVTGRKIQAKFALDPSLLGGAVVRIGDTIYDGSLRNRLNQMRARLASE